MTPRQAIAHFGGITAFADALGVTRQTVYNWIERDEIPWKWQCTIVVQTEGRLAAGRQKKAKA